MFGSIISGLMNFGQKYVMPNVGKVLDFGRKSAGTISSVFHSVKPFIKNLVNPSKTGDEAVIRNPYTGEFYKAGADGAITLFDSSK
jgi:hypothetical protein